MVKKRSEPQEDWGRSGLTEWHADRRVHPLRIYHQLSSLWCVKPAVYEWINVPLLSRLTVWLCSGYCGESEQTMMTELVTSAGGGIGLNDEDQWGLKKGRKATFSLVSFSASSNQLTVGVTSSFCVIQKGWMTFEVMSPWPNFRGVLLCLWQLSRQNSSSFPAQTQVEPGGARHSLSSCLCSSVLWMEPALEMIDDSDIKAWWLYVDPCFLWMITG